MLRGKQDNNPSPVQVLPVHAIIIIIAVTALSLFFNSRSPESNTLKILHTILDVG